MKRMIALDGAQGEGGGQILRSALSLSMITGQPFTITSIRAGRAKPGLLRQHLTAVKAAAEICRATVEGAELGSQRLVFRPGTVRGGEYRFAIGSAGSCTLVLQTVLPALWFADGPSRVEVSGGTDNPSAPPADFIRRVLEPLLAKMSKLIFAEPGNIDFSNFNRAFGGLFQPSQLVEQSGFSRTGSSHNANDLASQDF